MTTFLFLRHAHSQANAAGVLAGRTEGIHLSDKGEQQAEDLRVFLGSFQIQKIYSSPLERCIETVRPFSESIKKKISIAPGFIEMDYGSWSGEKLRELSKKSLWRSIQKRPETVTFPEGESFIQAWRRIERSLTDLSKSHPKSTVLICSHGDIIKMALTMTLRSPLNTFQNIIVDPASLSSAYWNGKQRTLLSSNLTMKNHAKVKKSKGLRNRRTLGGGSGG